MKTVWFDCDCKSAEHAIRFVFDEKDGDLWLDVHLNHYFGFFKRCIHAIKYVFGYKCQYGNFDVWCLDKKDTQKLIDLLEEKLKYDLKTS